MSYLDVPRLHITGQFYTDPSTVNNDPNHYDPAVTNPSPWQEPNGTHSFQWRNCQVVSAVNASGPVDSDTVIGAAVTSYDSNPARIVDLDVYQQGVSTIYGMVLTITLSDGGTITGNMDAATLNDFWVNAVLPTRSWGGDYGEDSYGGDMNACGFFQTIVRFNTANWPTTSSALLQQLRTVTLTENDDILLSFKFVVDAYENTQQSAYFRQGRMIGTLGPVFSGEPLYNTGQRSLLPRMLDTNYWYYPSFNNAYFKVDAVRSKLIIDLGNSICRQNAGGAAADQTNNTGRQTPGGPPVDLGTLTAMVYNLDKTYITIGAVDYSDFSYSNNAHITELPLTADQLQALQNGSLLLQMSRQDIGVQQILTENSGSNPDFCVEVRPIRLEGYVNAIQTTQVYISSKGAPVAGKQLAVYVESVHGNTPGATVPPVGYPGDTPQADGALQAAITPSDSNGFATVTLTVMKDPGSRTTQLDGQLYFINVYDPEMPVPDWTTAQPIQTHLISCTVRGHYPINENPAWPEIQAIMEPYAKLYPGMTSRINLTDESSFTIFAVNPPWSHGYNDNSTGPLGLNAGAITYYLTRPFEDPKLMPVSRDLSQGKLYTILYYILNLQKSQGQNTASTPTTPTT